jgi:hypothetical protein
MRSTVLCLLALGVLAAVCVLADKNSVSAAHQQAQWASAEDFLSEQRALGAGKSGGGREEAQLDAEYRILVRLKREAQFQRVD